MPKQTALFAQHQASGAKIVDFHGWSMPLHYGSQLQEHEAVRHAAGMFDVSHMTVVDLLGAGGRQFLRHLLANDVDKLTHFGRALYSCMLNHQGCVLDDLIVYARASDNYRLVVNSATCEKDLAWLQQQTEGLSVGIQERTDLAMIAVQGPDAIAQCKKIFTPAQQDAVSTLQAFESVEDDSLFIARTGYTGEDGFEIILPHEAAQQLWKQLLDNGVTPCGLGARDSLRLEAGMLLYGQDMDETTSPLESGLAWTVALEPTDRDFIGRAALELQKQQGVKRKMVGLVLQDKGIMRAGQAVFSDDKQVGEITSGGFSPSLQQSIAFARVDTTLKNQCKIDIRGKRLLAKVVKPRFIKNGKSLLET